MSHAYGIMKCLSVCQPFADLILSGIKTIELRNWNTRYRGDILIHAPQKIRHDDCKRLDINKTHITGAILGRARLADVKVYHDRDELRQDYAYHRAGAGFEGRRYGFVLTGAKRFDEPIPYKGRLGLYDVHVYRLE